MSTVLDPKRVDVEERGPKTHLWQNRSGKKEEHEK